MKTGRRRRNRRIQEALDGQGTDGMSLADVARELGVSYQLVWDTAHGNRNNRRVLKRFLELGVKPGDLDLPRDMRAGDAAHCEAAA